MYVYLFEGGWKFYDAIELMLGYQATPISGSVIFIYECMYICLKEVGGFTML